MEQLTIFDELCDEFKITKPIRLIELFAGYGSQSMALKRIGAKFEHYRVVEFDKYAIKSYNAVHGTDFPAIDITTVHAADLGIVDTNDYCYMMTYSFPCTDLSVSGLQKGMKKGSGTRSGLLWEVERLLKEMGEKPQVLLMENVPQVHGKKNKEDFQSWISFLESVGYRNYWQDLNAKNYGVAQNRNRCFMVSLLGDYSYDFPQQIPLKNKLKDYLDDNVDEKYYINNEKTDKLIKQLIDNGTLPQHNLDRQTCVTEFQNAEKLETSLPRINAMINYNHVNKIGNDVAKTLCARDYKGFGTGFNTMNGVIEVMPDVKIIGQMDNMIDHTFESANRVYDVEGVAPTLNTCGGGGLQPKILESQIVAMRGRNPDNPSDRTVGSTTEQRLEINMQGTSKCLTSVQKDNLLLEKPKYRIRKLTPREYGRLMGVSDEDIDKMASVNSNSQLYKQFGNSIVVDVMVAIFEKLNIEQEKEKND